jgi:ABC-type transport system involved in multi-copper enzyme maturation permease subunit
MRGSLSAELLKLRKRPAVWLVGAVFVLLGLFAYVFPYLSYRRGVTPPGTRSGEELLLSTLPSSLVPSALNAWPLLGGAVVLVLGVLIAGSEYGWRTLKTVHTQRAGRLTVLGGTVAAIVLATALMVLASLAADALASLAIAAAERRAVHWPSLTVMARGVAAGWLIVTMWCVVGMFLGTVLRGTAVAVGIGIVWMLVVEQIIRAWFAPAVAVIDALVRWLPGTNAGSLVAALGVHTEQQGAGAPGVNGVVDGTHATLVLAGYVVVLVTATAVAVRRRDIT